MTDDEKLAGVHPKLVGKHHTLALAMRSFDIWLIPLEGVRTRERQAELYAQGRTAPGPIVTHAPPGQGPHEVKADGFGHAIDYGMRDYVHTERGLWDEAHPWVLLGMMAKRLGLTWGGDFKALKDLGHVELPE